MNYIRITILVIVITTIVAALTLAIFIAYKNKYHKPMIADLPGEYPLITKDKKYTIRSGAEVVIKELIEELEKYPVNLPILAAGCCGNCYAPIINSRRVSTDEPCVILEIEQQLVPYIKSFII